MPSARQLLYSGLAALVVFLIVLKAVGLFFQMGLLSAVVLVVVAFFYALTIIGFYAVGEWRKSETLRLIGHILTLLGVFVGWSYLGPLWAKTLVLHTEMGGWGVPFFYVGALFGGPIALGLWLTIVLKKPPKVAIAYAILTLLVVATGSYQGFRQSGLRAPLSREPIFAFCPGDARISEKSGELPWETTHFVSRVALKKGCLFHVFVHSDAIEAYEEDEMEHRLHGEYLEQVVGLRLGDSVNEMRAKRVRAAARSREWLRENAPQAVSAGDDDDSARGETGDGGFVPSMSEISDDPGELLSSMPRWLVTLLLAALLAVIVGPFVNKGVFGEVWHAPFLPFVVFIAALLLTAFAGWALHGSSWWAFAPRKSDVVEVDRLHREQVVRLGWQDYTAADTTQQWWVAYLGDPDCTSVLEARGACTQEVCLQVQHGAAGYRWVVPAELGEEQRCFRPGDLGRLTSSGEGTGVMSVRVYSGGGKAVFGPPEWVRRRLQERHEQALAVRTARVGGLGLALVRARCISGMFDRSGAYPGACGRGYRPLASP